jgi:hypothetical protein
MNTNDILVNAIREHETNHHNHQLAVESLDKMYKETPINEAVINVLRDNMLRCASSASYSSGVLQGIYLGLLAATLAPREEN